MSHSFAHHIDKAQALSSVRSSESSLITPERYQKLELLIHLISNLRQALVICGSRGIGKTTLLDELRQQKSQVWSMYTIQAASDLSFESIQEQLSQFLNQQYPAYKHHTFSSIVSELDKQNQKIVFIIDNAGQLVPGLIQTLIQYAAATLCLRIVFSLTHDEIQLKNSTDRAIEDCHFIEIPTLTEKQCGIYLKNLSAQPGAKIPMSACNDRVIEKIFRETHGVPGRIVSEFPRLSEYSMFHDYRLLSFAFIAVMAVLGISFLISDEPEIKITAENNSPPLFQNAKKLEYSETQAFAERKVGIKNVTVSKTIENNDDNIISISLGTKDEIHNTTIAGGILGQPLLKKTTDFQRTGQKTNSLDGKLTVAGKQVPAEVDSNIKIQVNSIFDETQVKNSVNDILPRQKLKESKVIQGAEVEKLVKNQPISVEKVIIADKKIDKPKLVEKVISTEKGIAHQAQSGIIEDTKKDDSLWLLKQPEKYYTIQLMVLSKRQSAMEFLKKNPGLKDNLKVFQKNESGQKKYILIYGAFKSAAMATKKMSLLPVKYRKSWLRRFKTLQKEINNN